jgi:hypothetical protein
MLPSEHFLPVVEVIFLIYEPLVLLSTGVMADVSEEIASMRAGPSFLRRSEMSTAKRE